MIGKGRSLLNRKLRPNAARLLRDPNVANMSKRYIGHLDGILGSQVRGWVRNTFDASESPNVGLFVGDELLATAPANEYREDLQKLGHGACAYNLPIDQFVYDAAAKADKYIRIKLMTSPPFDLGQIKVARDETDMDETRAQNVRSLITANFRIFEAALRANTENYHLPTETRGPRKYDDLVKSLRPLAWTAEAPPMSKYVDFTSKRFNLTHTFRTDEFDHDRVHLLEWYLRHYHKARASYRIPLGAEEISYLNEPQLYGGQRFSLTRATWMALLSDNTKMKTDGINLNDSSNFRSLIYWWAIHHAHSIGAEDCLVPDYYVAELANVAVGWKDKKYPLSFFAESYFNENIKYHFLDMSAEADRKVYMLILMFEAIRRPDILRYIPRPTIIEAFKTDGKTNSFTNLALSSGVLDNKRGLIEYSEFARALSIVGYDLEASRFLTISPIGNRVHAASLPIPKPERKTDVQIIGPFQKASGLGQATRLSAMALEKSNLSVNLVDFGMDNPAAEGFSRLLELSNFRSAKINLIHLNAESVPLAFAYAPDVFTGAYNIGYFFWELDSPAACHQLALEMLDEVWVSSQYGHQIYSHHAGIPVTNVGMTYEDLPEIDKEVSKKILRRRLNLSSSDFIFLVAFDSFSFIQRKNPLAVVRAFQRAFPTERNARLVIKTQNRGNVLDSVQVAIWQQLDASISQDTRVTVINETMSYREVLELKSGSDCYVSLHRSEGWGFGMIEAMNLGTPVISTAYSGNMEFCNEDTAYLVDYDEVLVGAEDYIFVLKGQKWAEPSIDSAAERMREIFDDPQRGRVKADEALSYVQTHFSVDVIGDRYQRRVRQILQSVST